MGIVRGKDRRGLGVAGGQWMEERGLRQMRKGIGEDKVVVGAGLRWSMGRKELSSGDEMTREAFIAVAQWKVSKREH